MPWGEALDLAKMLVRDPTSQLGVAVGGYDFSWSREWAATVDLYDLMHHIAWAQGGSRGSRPKPYPRPWRESRTNERHLGDTEGRSDAEVVAYLTKLGHKIAG